MALSKITSQHRLRLDAALSYLRMRRDGMPAGVTSAHRPEDEQQDLYDKWRSGNGNFALPPGESNHVKGIALDLPVAARAWVKEHGRKYGWTPVTNEPWHFDYNPALDQTAQEAIMAELKALGDDINWLKKRVGGSGTDPSIATQLAQLNAKTDAILAALGAMTGGAVDATKVAAAVDKALADNFAKIPDAVADELAGRLTN